MHPRLPTILLACTLAAGGAARPAAPAANTGRGGADPYARVRGMTISCPGSGRVWGTDLMVDAMRELRGMGINWVCIHPYAGIGDDGTVGSGRMASMDGDPPIWLTRPIREAHALGLKIMIKPHLAYWGSDFSWRGAIAFDTEARWQRFFTSYQRWITRLAEVTHDADAFAVGTELDGTVHREADWRRIIAAVRAKTQAPLTYSANWDRFESVGFWDALDAIGIQSYFPLVDHDGLPAREELDAAWGGLIRRLERYGALHHRRVLLAELGYNRSARAAVRPWDGRQGGPNAEEIQRRCLDSALRALAHSDRVSGAFLWKWFPGTRHRGNFLMMSPAMRELIEAHWAERGAADPP